MILPPVEAVVLDMDGLLIDTEPVWRAAQSAVFAGFGVVAVPETLLAADPRYREADLVLKSLAGLHAAALRRLGVPVPG